MSDNKNPIEMLLDEDCNDNIVLFDEDGESTEFEQIAVVPLDDQLYCILRPIDMPELDEDEAFVFEISEDDEEGFIDLAVKFRAVAAVERNHEKRYRALLNNVETKQVFAKADTKVWECRNCGHLATGKNAPQICPVCAHPQSYFEIHAENY